LSPGPLDRNGHVKIPFVHLCFCFLGFLGLIPNSKGNNQQSEETTYRMGKNSANYSSNKGLISRIYEKILKLNDRK
jgi:hypothetical protein